MKRAERTNGDGLRKGKRRHNLEMWSRRRVRVTFAQAQRAVVGFTVLVARSVGGAKTTELGSKVGPPKNGRWDVTKGDCDIIIPAAEK